MFTAAQIRGLGQKLAFPGQDALFKAAKREASRAKLQAPTRAQIREATATLTQPQMYGKRPPSGHVVALKENERSQADLASFQSLENTKGNKGNKFLMVAIDVYSKKIYGAPVTGKDGPTIRSALQAIFAKAKCRVLSTDAGLEWRNPEVAEYLQQQGVVSQVKDPSDINGLALADAGGRADQKCFIQDPFGQEYERLDRQVAGRSRRAERKTKASAGWHCRRRCFRERTDALPDA